MLICQSSIFNSDSQAQPRSSPCSICILLSSHVFVPATNSSLDTWQLLRLANLSQPDQVSPRFPQSITSTPSATAAPALSLPRAICGYLDPALLTPTPILTRSMFTHCKRELKIYRQKCYSFFSLVTARWTNSARSLRICLGRYPPDGLAQWQSEIGFIKKLNSITTLPDQRRPLWMFLPNGLEYVAISSILLLRSHAV
jgi:hypothetical protein